MADMANHEIHKTHEMSLFTLHSLFWVGNNQNNRPLQNLYLHKI